MATASIAQPAVQTPPDYRAVVIAPLREDLVTSEQIYLGRAYVIVKNPISLTYCLSFIVMAFRKR